MSVHCRSLVLAAALFALLGMGSAAFAQEASPGHEHWKSSWTGYLWTPGFNGDAIIAGTPVDVDVSVSDAIDVLDEVETSFAGHYEGNKEPWGVVADISYWRMKFDFMTAAGPGECKPSQWIVELAGARTMSIKKMGENTVQRVQALVGGRYNQLKLKAKVPDADIDASKSRNYFDPFVGARVFQALSRQWGANFRADVGGFGIGSDLSWQVIATFGYNISEKNSILLGWRYYSQDYEKDDFEWEVAQSGPFLAWQTRF